MLKEETCCFWLLTTPGGRWTLRFLASKWWTLLVHPRMFEQHEKGQVAPRDKEERNSVIQFEMMTQSQHIQLTIPGKK